MQAIDMESKWRTAAISALLIVAGGIVGFFLGGTFAANLVTGDSHIADAATVALSAIGTGILGAAIGLYACSRMRS